MLRGRSPLRTAALIAAGGIALHQLRYALGGADGGTAAAGAHDYLHALVPAVAVLLAVAAGHFVALLLRSARGRGACPAPIRLSRLWGLATGALLALYATQELVEVTVVHGNPPAVASLLAHGGWWTVPLALVIGLLVALVERGAEAAIAAASRRARAATGLPPARTPRAPARADLPRRHVLARHLASRAPPIPSV